MLRGKRPGLAYQLNILAVKFIFILFFYMLSTAPLLTWKGAEAARDWVGGGWWQRDEVGFG